MTGREKMEAALSEKGTRDIPVVIPYDGIFIRDHWDEITSHPWWIVHESSVDRQLAWWTDVIEAIGQDWYFVPSMGAREWRAKLVIQERAEGVFRVNRETGQEERLLKPEIGGWPAPGAVKQDTVQQTPDSVEELDRRIGIAQDFDGKSARESGRYDLAEALAQGPARDLFPMRFVNSPLWLCYGLWGFEGMMMMLADRPELIHHACKRHLAHCLHAVEEAGYVGARGVWIEECMTDMISPAAFAEFNVPYLKHLVECIRNAGLKSIYYFCGSPVGKWDRLFEIGADALSLEEGKKTFAIDIEDVARRADGRVTLLGNLDAIGVLHQGSEEELKSEIRRQIDAGRKNGGRFIMSLGSPVTPETPASRVRQYCELARSLGRTD